MYDTAYVTDNVLAAMETHFAKRLSSENISFQTKDLQLGYTRE